MLPPPQAASFPACSPTNNCVLFASRRLKLGQVGGVGLFVTTIVGAQKYLRGCPCQHAQLHMLVVSIIVAIGITWTAGTTHSACSTNTKHTWTNKFMDMDSIIHSKSEKVCRIAFSVKKKLRKKCVNPGVIFGPFGVILGHFGSFLGHFGSFWVILGPFWVIFGSLWAILGNFLAILDHFVSL